VRPAFRGLRLWIKLLNKMPAPLLPVFILSAVLVIQTRAPCRSLSPQPWLAEPNPLWHRLLQPRSARHRLLQRHSVRRRLLQPRLVRRRLLHRLLVHHRVWARLHLIRLWLLFSLELQLLRPWFLSPQSPRLRLRLLTIALSIAAAGNVSTLGEMMPMA
jgi:hypothetical protein